MDRADAGEGLGAEVSRSAFMAARFRMLVMSRPGTFSQSLRGETLHAVSLCVSFEWRFVERGGVGEKGKKKAWSLHLKFL